MKGMKGVLTEGLKNKSPSSSDASTKTKGGSVDKGATRSSVGEEPPMIGPRVA